MLVEPLTPPQTLSLILGCYTPTSPYGLHRLDLNSVTGELQANLLEIPIKDPSYFDVYQSQIYAISEVSADHHPQIHQYSLCKVQCNKTGQFDISGDSPCFIAMNAQHKLATTAQYGSGHVDVFQLDDSLDLKQHLQSIDSTSKASAQQVSHAHQAIILNHTKTLVSVDLGLDRLSFYPYDQHHECFSIQNRQELDLASGSGPRHVEFTQDEQFGLLLCEVSEQLIVIHDQQQQWQIINAQAAFPNTDNGQAGGAIKLSPDERFFYLSGRRQNIISCFAFDNQTGTVNHQYSVDCGGDFPRDFAISENGEWLVVANQNDHSVVSFKRNVFDGRIQHTGHSLFIDMPVCVKFFEG
ncbi:lactonase family protein [Vibrio algicola]|nr:beta-propeller fold lactonase family protein [Vibrio algicola]